MNLESASLSKQGLASHINQDAVLVDVAHGLFAVADGMGGMTKGELASRIAICYLKRKLRADFCSAEGHFLFDVLRSVFEEVNDAILAKVSGHTRRMGTTLTVAAVRTNQLFIAHSGDSRAYLANGEWVQQLTQDHTLVADMVRKRLLPEKDAHEHPCRSILNGGLGLWERCKVQTSRHALHPGQVLVLCTDGLTSKVSNDEIAECVSRSCVGAAASDLVERAMGKGSVDDITVVVVKNNS